MQSVKCVVVGDSGVGKTYLLSTYIRKSFPKDYIPDFYSTYTTQVEVDGQTVSLTLGDTAGREGYEQLRPLCYGLVDVIIICFSIDSPASCQNARLKWLPEVKHHCPDAPIILVGTKSDLRGRGEQNQTTVTHQQGTAMAKQIKAVKYLECASVSQDGLDEVFDEAVRTFFVRRSNTTKEPCVLL